MLRLRVSDLRNDAGAGRQRAVHPAQMSLGDFHPTITDRRQAALLECQAVAVVVEQGIVAKASVWHEQRFEKAHDFVPVTLHA